jgi:hypothetical protein
MIFSKMFIKKNQNLSGKMGFPIERWGTSGQYFIRTYFLSCPVDAICMAVGLSKAM